MFLNIQMAPDSVGGVASNLGDIAMDRSSSGTDRLLDCRDLQTFRIGEYIPLYRPFLCGKEKEYVNQCLDSTWISSKGAFVERFETAFGRFLKAEHVTSVCNGTAALHLALETLGLGPGDEVIVPSLTYVASVNTILQTGATPVFADSLDTT
jgi:perosamine synthetase